MSNAVEDFDSVSTIPSTTPILTPATILRLVIFTASVLVVDLATRFFVTSVATRGLKNNGGHPKNTRRTLLPSFHHPRLLAQVQKPKNS